MWKPDRTTIGVGLCIVAMVSTLAYLVQANIALNDKLDSVLSEIDGPVARTSPPVDSSVDSFFGPMQSLTTPDFPNDWDPFREMEDMQQRIDQIFGDAFHRFNGSDTFSDFFELPGISPRMDLMDEGDRFVARANLPGSEEANIEVRLEGNVLHVSAVSKAETREESGAQPLRQERRVGKFQRQMTLPAPVDPETLETTYEDGVLTITVQKANETKNES